MTEHREVRLVEQHVRVPARQTAPSATRVLRSAGWSVSEPRTRPRIGDRTTIVVIGHDRIEELRGSLDRLAQLPEAPPVIVIDNGSDPPIPRSLVDGNDGWRLIRRPVHEGAAARNIGVAMACTPYVAFSDDDTWWEPGSLDLAADVLDAHPSVAVVNAHTVVQPAGSDDPISEELVQTPLRAEGTAGHVLGSFLAGASVVRRSAFLAVGGFERRLLVGGEEELLATDLRMAGWRIVHIPQAHVHRRPSSARDPDLRRRQGVRNHLWLIWLRRPWPSMLRRTIWLLRRSPKDRHTLHALVAALAGLPWVLRNRRCLPEPSEREQRLLDRAEDRSAARRSVS